ncbi:hypothetical protein [Mesorhizobium carmichaelinearum]|uniref:hypothetical protein n=1 Tax=Mesorhizobium carmichaelinearum TaxID=1208188 RepID=UPI00117C221E|nr:hypothetical protein [Mesorhizobium carmichaelinearum]
MLLREYFFSDGPALAWHYDHATGQDEDKSIVNSTNVSDSSIMYPPARVRNVQPHQTHGEPSMTAEMRQIEQTFSLPRTQELACGPLPAAATVSARDRSHFVRMPPIPSAC